jgi:hypothetical protein
MPKIEDTYFSSVDEALTVAKEQNTFGAYENLQLCYYAGDKIQSELKNLIHLPLDDIVETLISLNTRFPTKSFIDLNNYLQEYLQKKQYIYDLSIKKIQDIKLNFNEKKRVYISADYGGKVVLKIYKLLRDEFLSQDCEIFFDINDELTIMDDTRRVQNIANFQPHILFNINRVRNDFLNEDMFNFIWFQDPTLVLYDSSHIASRKNDYYFYLLENFKDALLEKGILDKKLFYQPFATDKTVFYLDKSINKEEKIIFIGNNYFEVVSPAIDYKENKLILNEITNLFNNNQLDKQTLDRLSEEYLQKGLIRSKEHLEMFIFPSMVRIEVLKWLVTQNFIKVEIYGKGWDTIEELRPYICNFLKSGEELRSVCNSSKYSLIVHPEYYSQQRLFEASACESIPVVYKGVNNREIFKYEENVLLFNDKKSLFNQLKKSPKKEVGIIAKEASYETFIKKILHLTEKENCYA